MTTTKTQKLPQWKGYVLYPADSSDLGIKISDRVVPNTFVAVNPRNNQPVQMVTIMPSDLHLGWDQCGACRNQFRQCKCKTGVYHTRSVAWCLGYETSPTRSERSHTLSSDYEHLFDPFGDIARKATLVAKDARKGTLQAHTTPKRVNPVQPATKTPKARQKPAQGVLGPVENVDIDLAAVDSAAVDAATDARAKLVKRLDKKKRRVIKRKV